MRGLAFDRRLDPVMISSNALAEPLLPTEPSGDEVLASAPSPIGLSNDYLNHYSEVLMLIEMSAADPELAAELARWRPIGYRSYFAASPLRRAEEALAAYDALPEARRVAFEAMTRAMDALARLAIAGLAPPCAPEDAAQIIEMTTPSLRRLISQAATFLNTGGEAVNRHVQSDRAQAMVDAVIERGRRAG